MVTNHIEQLNLIQENLRVLGLELPKGSDIHTEVGNLWRTFALRRNECTIGYNPNKSQMWLNSTKNVAAKIPDGVGNVGFEIHTREIQDQTVLAPMLLRVSGVPDSYAEQKFPNVSVSRFLTSLMSHLAETKDLKKADYQNLAQLGSGLAALMDPYKGTQWFLVNSGELVAQVGARPWVYPGVLNLVDSSVKVCTRKKDGSGRFVSIPGDTLATHLGLEAMVVATQDPLADPISDECPF